MRLRAPGTIGDELIEPSAYADRLRSRATARRSAGMIFPAPLPQTRSCMRPGFRIARIDPAVLRQHEAQHGLVLLRVGHRRLDVEIGMAADAVPLDQVACAPASGACGSRHRPMTHARRARRSAPACARRTAAGSTARSTGSASMRMMVWFLSSTSQIAPSDATVMPTGAPCGRTPLTLCQPPISSVERRGRDLGLRSRCGTRSARRATDIVAHRRRLTCGKPRASTS